jgi:hypothetical protein
MRGVPAALLAAALGGGCAVTDVTLTQPARFDVAPGSRRGQGREIVVGWSFSDRRSEVRCGMKKNAYNTDTASVYCGQPDRMLADLIAWHLSLAGFKVLRDRRQAGPSAIVLTGGLDKAFLEPKVNFFTVQLETDITLRLAATTGLSAQRRFYVKGDQATVFAGSEDMQRSFDAGVRQLVIDVVGAVARLAEQFPAPPPESTPSPVVAPEAPSGPPEDLN